MLCFFSCFWLSVSLQLIAWKEINLLRVEWDIEPYTLTHSSQHGICVFICPSVQNCFKLAGQLHGCGLQNVGCRVAGTDCTDTWF